MRKILLSTLIFIFTFTSIQGLLAQEVQWAVEVIEFSSELEETQFSVKQLLGKPNVFPWGEGSPNAWTPAKPSSKEFVKVGFANPMPIKQIAIAESYNPSTLSEIYFYDEAGKEYMIIQREPVVVNQPGRFLRLFTELTTYNVAAVKLVFIGDAVPGYYSIDAIGVSDSDTPIDLKLELVPNVVEDIEAEELDSRVNSEYEELGPTLSPNGKQLFFGRKFHPENVGGVEDYEDIWVSDLDTVTNEWKLARNIGAPLNTADPNFISSITPDGNTLVLLLGNEYSGKKRLVSGASISSKQGDGWSEPEALQIDDFYNYSDKANFYLANSRKTMVMSIERDDTYGDRDLYVSFMKRDGAWTAPMNLGASVNTATSESSPFLASDDKTLFFSSEGYVGFGKSDIYMTRRLDDTWQNWSEPLNMGPQVNSTGDDLFFTMPAQANFAYYTKEDSVGDMNIYRLPMPLFYEIDPVITISGRVLDGETQEPLDALVTYETLKDGKEVGQVRTDPTTGEYTITLPAGEEYQYVVRVDGYLPMSENVDLTDQKESKSFTNDMIMVPIKTKSEISLNNVFFNFDSYALLPKSVSELNRMVEVMKDNKEIEVTIIGHTDAVGPETYNDGLSERRAKAVVDYLVENGIERERLTFKGLGESQPAVPNTSVENRAQNRRVNFQID